MLILFLLVYCCSSVCFLAASAALAFARCCFFCSSASAANCFLDFFFTRPTRRKCPVNVKKKERVTICFIEPAWFPQLSLLSYALLSLCLLSVCFLSLPRDGRLRDSRRVSSIFCRKNSREKVGAVVFSGVVGLAGCLGVVEAGVLSVFVVVATAVLFSDLYDSRPNLEYST